MRCLTDLVTESLAVYMYALFRLFQQDLQQLFARCWSKMRRRGQPPPAGLALSLSVHRCARVMVARPPADTRPRDNILLQNVAIDPLRRTLYALSLIHI